KPEPVGPPAEGGIDVHAGRETAREELVRGDDARQEGIESSPHARRNGNEGRKLDAAVEIEFAEEVEIALGDGAEFLIALQFLYVGFGDRLPAAQRNH